MKNITYVLAKQHANIYWRDLARLLSIEKNGWYELRRSGESGNLTRRKEESKIIMEDQVDR
jgi:hypothetical protein